MDARRFLREYALPCARLLPLSLAANLVLVFLALFLPVGALVSAALVTAANLAILLRALWSCAQRTGAAMDAIQQGAARIAEGKDALLSESGEFAALCAELNRAGYRAADRERNREEWVRGISHDIRTPLSLVLGYAGELEDDSALPPDARAQAGIIRRQAVRLRRLVDDLGLISRLEASMRPPRPELFPPVELARRAIVEFLEREPGELFPVELRAEAAPEAIRGDASLIERMLGNLLQNAAAHNPNGCRIRVSVAGTPGLCRFTVADDGAGAPAQKLAELNAEDFPDRVYRPLGPIASRPSYPAHGLGLRLVCRVAQAHGGRARFSATDPHGFRAEIDLPVPGEPTERR